MTEEKEIQNHNNFINEKTFKDIFEEFPVPLLLIDTNFNILNANSIFLDLLNYTKNEVLNKSILDLLKQSDIDKFLSIKNSIDEKNLVQIDLLGFKTKQNEIKYFEIKVKINCFIKDSYCIILSPKQLFIETPEYIEKLKIFDETIFKLSVSSYLLEGNLDEFIRQTTELTSEAMNVERVSVWFYNEDFTLLRCIDLYERSKKLHSSGVVLRETEFRNEFEALKNSTYVDASDGFNDPRTIGYRKVYLEPLNIFSLLDVSIKSSENLFGVICFEHVNQLHYWHREEISFGCQVANQLVICIINSEKKKAERKIFEIERSYRQLFETLTQGLVLHNNEGKIILVNKAAEEILGIEEKQLINRETYDSIFNAIHLDGSRYKDDEHPSMITIKTGTFQKNVIMGVFNYRLNKYVWLQIDTIPIFKDNEQKPYLVYSIFQDITDKIIAERALKESEIKFKSLFDNMNEGSALHELVFDDRGIPIDYRIIDVNSNYEVMTMLKKEDVIGKLASEVYQSSPPPLLTEYSNVALTSIPLSFEFFYEPLNRFFQISASKWKDNGFATIFTDITQRKKYERAIEKSERKFRSLFEDSAEANLLIKDGIFIDCNKAALKLLNCKREYIVGKKPYEISPELQPDGNSSIEKANSLIEKCFKSGSVSFEWVHTTPENRIVWVEVILTAIEIEDEYTIFTSWRDISEKVISQRLLQFRLELNEYSATHSVNEIITYALDRIETYIDCNFGFFFLIDEIYQINLFALSTNSLSKLNITENINSEFITEKFSLWKECLETKKDLTYNDIFEIKNIQDNSRSIQINKLIFIPVLRNLRVVAILCIGDKQGNFYDNDISFLSTLSDIIYDIVEKKKSAEALIQSELRYSAIVNNSPEIILIHQRGVITFVNKAATEISGYEKEELLNRSIFEFLTPESGKIVKEKMERRSRGEKIEGYEAEFRVKSGEVRIFIVKTEQIFYGKEPAVLAILVDITERKRNEEKIKQYAQELKEAIDTKDKFFSIISHDLKSPMHGMLGASEILANEIDNLSKEKIIRFATELNRMLKNQNQLLEDLLTWSRIQMDKMNYEPTEFNVNIELKANLSLLGMMAIKKDIELINHIPEEATLFADKNMFNLVMRNLISNAIKFSFRGGKIEIFYEENYGYKTFLVKDYGVGISEQAKNNIFDISKQHSTLGTEKERGTGLGLSLCKEIMEKHNGTISVQSELGKGSTFIISFPKLN